MHLCHQEQIAQTIPGKADSHMVFRLVSKPGNYETRLIFLTWAAVGDKQKI